MHFPSLKMTVKDGNEIWSLDLAYIENLAKHNQDVKYLLVAGDCLSGYFRVEPMKTNYATEAADALKKTINQKQLKKVWIDDGTEFLGAFKRVWTHEQSIFIALLRKKICFCQTESLFTETIIHRYLEKMN